MCQVCVTCQGVRTAHSKNRDGMRRCMIHEVGMNEGTMGVHDSTTNGTVFNQDSRALPGTRGFSSHRTSLSRTMVMRRGVAHDHLTRMTPLIGQASRAVNLRHRRERERQQISDVVVGTVQFIASRCDPSQCDGVNGESELR